MEEEWVYMCRRQLGCPSREACRVGRMGKGVGGESRGKAVGNVA